VSAPPRCGVVAPAQGERGRARPVRPLARALVLRVLLSSSSPLPGVAANPVVLRAAPRSPPRCVWFAGVWGPDPDLTRSCRGSGAGPESETKQGRNREGRLCPRPLRPCWYGARLG
jgi:hypothetical protein